MWVGRWKGEREGAEKSICGNAFWSFPAWRGDGWGWGYRSAPFVSMHFKNCSRVDFSDLNMTKKYPSKIFFSKIWLRSYRAKKELNNLFTFQDEPLLYGDLAQMIVIGHTIFPKKSTFGPLCISLVLLIHDTEQNCQTSQAAQLSTATILLQNELHLQLE